MAFNNSINANVAGFQSLSTVGVWTGRTLVPGAGISITNADGISGNPMISNTSGLGRFPITPYVVGSSLTAGYSTIQAAVNAAAASGSAQLIYVQPGTYVENLVFPNIGLTIKGDGGGLTVISGAHTPSSTAAMTFDGFVLVSATDIFNSSAAGSASLEIFNSFIVITNGYSFNLPNWTGFLAFDNCGQASTTDGVVNNPTGAAIIKFINSEVGNGTGKTFNVAGAGQVRLDTMLINCPSSFVGSGNIIFQGFTRFTQPLTIGGSRSGDIEDTYWTTGSSQAFVMSSSGNITISNSVVDSSNNPAIGGSGAGTLTISTLSFLSNANIANTLTIASTGGLFPGGNLGSSGYVWTSNGAKACPTFQAPSGTGSVVVQTFTTTGTYTPTAGMKYCTIEVVGGGGGSGGCATTGANTVSIGTSGGGGGYARKTVAAATIGVSQTVTIGAGGTACSAGANNAGAGGTTSVGVIVTATGGQPGTGGTAAAANILLTGGNGGLGASGDVNIPGQTGGNGFAIWVVTLGGVTQTGAPGSSYFGGALGGITTTTVSAGVAGDAIHGYGQGAVGAAANVSQSQQAGAVGAPGFVVVTEYINI